MYNVQTAPTLAFRVGAFLFIVIYSTPIKEYDSKIVLLWTLQSFFGSYAPHWRKVR